MQEIIHALLIIMGFGVVFITLSATNLSAICCNNSSSLMSKAFNTSFLTRMSLNEP